jgi:dipeptidyl aminopeptidase/acylaminoacyl peptidase
MSGSAMQSFTSLQRRPLRQCSGRAIRIFSFALFVGLVLSAQAQVRDFRQVEIAPDGSRVAWVQDALDAAGEVAGTAIYVCELKDGNCKPKRISTAEGTAADEDSVAWSPDSKQIAFLSDAGGDNQSQLYVASVDGGKVRKLTSVTGALADPAWSPDGKTVALLLTENAQRANPLSPMLPETGVIADKVYEQRLAVVEVATGKVSQLSPRDMYVYEFDWSPDSRSFAMIAAHGAGDANWYVPQLYTLNTGAREMKAIYKPHLQIADPRWSPDGNNIGFIEGLMSDESFIGGDITVVPAGGGTPRNVTPGIPASPSALYWQTPKKILFAEVIDGEAGVSTVDLASGQIAKVWAGPDLITEGFVAGMSLALASDRKTSAVIRDSWGHPPEVWAGSVGEWKQLTHVNDEMQPGWGDVKSLHWSNDGMKIQGWLMYPTDYLPNKRYPMIVVPHGGPAGEANIGWPGVFFNVHKLSAHGYFVFYPNPRGSYGAGENFTQGNVKDFGYGDFRDIMAGVDEILRTLPVDKDRLGITGWSYGGYMTMWAVTQTNRFRAAVAGAGIANWESYYGQNDIDEWMIPYFGASVYDDPAVYAKSAPMTFIKNVKTPTLVLVGERDGECPAPQSREFWHALKTFGVESELVIYPGEGHVFGQRDHQRDVVERTLAWFDHYLKPASTAEERSAGPQ